MKHQGRTANAGGLQAMPLLKRAARLGALAALALLAAALPAVAGAPDAPQKTRIERLENAVLAPCCYTEPVSRHQSEIALKMRLEIAQWVAAGQTDQQILGAYVQLYGSKVLVDPRTAPAWWTPWIPWLALIAGTVSMLWFLKRWRSRTPRPEPSPDFDAGPLPDIEEDDFPAAAGR
jgi:cytochrome c-type biogenesis protein CcmH/NrfF